MFNFMIDACKLLENTFENSQKSLVIETCLFSLFAIL